MQSSDSAPAEAGVIGRSVALLSQSKLGLGLTVFIIIKTNRHAVAWFSQCQRVVEQLPGTLEVHRLGGDIDYLVKAVVPDMPGYNAPYQQLVKTDLSDVSVNSVLETMKHTTELYLWPPGQRRSFALKAATLIF